MEVSATQRLAFESGIAIPIDDSSQIGEARRTAIGVAAAAGLSEVDAGRFAIIAAEAATNITKHATRGEILLRSAVETLRAVDLIAVDNGPGIRDVEKALRDGYSTAGSSGTGLGAMARLSTAFDVFTAPDAGTVISVRIEATRPGSKQPGAFELGVVRAAKRGEAECGDDWGIVVDEDRGRAVLTVADGLGHGVAAAEASRRAVQLAADNAADPPGHVVAALHRGLRPTRGAAVAVAEMKSHESGIRFAGLGNIAAAIVGPSGSRSLMSHNGIAGHEMRKIQELSSEWPADVLLIMHSDGMSSRWDLGKYPGLIRRSPSVVAGVIYRDFSRGRDDALIVVVRRSS